MNVEFPLKLAVSKTARVEEMRSGEEVSAMVRLHESPPEKKLSDTSKL